MRTPRLVYVLLNHSIEATIVGLRKEVQPITDDVTDDGCQWVTERAKQDRAFMLEFLY